MKITTMAHTVTNWITRLLSHLSSKIAPANIDPSAALESVERVSAWATFAIFVGIALEAWATIHFQGPDETVWEVAGKLVGDLLIGSALLVEVICILRTISESRREKSESDRKVAEANERAAKAELEIARLKAPRTLNEDAFIASLAGKPSWPVVELLYVDASDCSFLAIQIAVALTNAGWTSATPKPIRGINPGCVFPASFIPETVSYGGNPTGVAVVATEVSLDEPHPLPALQRALMEGLSTKQANGGRDPSMRPATLRVVVAPRQ